MLFRLSQKYIITFVEGGFLSYIKIFFKELKQHLKIKSFVGTNENAMWIQIWTALITILLLRYLKELAKCNWSLNNLIAFLRMNLFVKILLTERLNNQFRPPEDFSVENRQESLFLQGAEIRFLLNLSNTDYF
jgi:hypothetical protein